MRAIICGRGGSKIVEFTYAELEHAHQEFYPEHYQGKLPLTDEAKQPEPPADYWPPPRSARSPALVKIPAGTERQYCKDESCRKAIWMVTHPKTGKPTPAACESEIELTDGTKVGTGAFPPYLNAAPGRETLPMDGLGYSHFIDCPSRREFRRK